MEKLETQNATSDPSCVTCKGSGAILKYDENRGAYVYIDDCECRKQRVMSHKLKNETIPMELRDNKIGNFRIDFYYTAEGRELAKTAKRMTVNYVQKYVEYKGAGKGLYFYSKEPGSGKTRLAVSLGNALHSQHDESVRFLTTIDLLNKIKSTFGKSNSCDEDETEVTQYELIESLKNVNILIIDDIGTERPTAWVEEIFFSILNGRYEKKKVTIFTSNCQIEELAFADKITQRIAKLAMPIAMPNESVRMALVKTENGDMREALLV